MKISDILGMSLSSLWRRKMRTVLTVLGVIIGTASIVVMLSLGLGLKQTMLDQVGSAGGLTEILVYADEDYGSDSILLDDSTLDNIMSIDHVESISPQLWYNMPVQVGKYESYITIAGVSEEYLSGISLGRGELPKANSSTLSVVAGNQVLTDFFDYTTGDYPYWDNEELPDVDLMTANVMGGIEKEEAYTDDGTFADASDISSGYVDPTFSEDAEDFSTEDEFTDDSDVDGFDTDSAEDDFMMGNEDFSEDDMSEESMSYSNFSNTMKRVQLKVTGITEGNEDTYSEYSYYCYTDMDTLKTFLKQNYSLNEIIPGQPTDRSGKPYRDLKYSQVTVKIDEADYVEDVLQTIQDMGYRGEANKEWLEEIEKEFMIIEAVLGGIGAVSLLVAAIGIANTMTMSTYERTKEIGVMKVLGCSLGNIRSMFLAEAAFIGFLGGILGVLLSYLLSIVVNKLAPLIMTDFADTSAKISMIPIWLVLVSIVFSTIIGMIAGFFPAQRATKLSPLAAIRNE